MFKERKTVPSLSRQRSTALLEPHPFPCGFFLVAWNNWETWKECIYYLSSSNWKVQCCEHKTLLVLFAAPCRVPRAAPVHGEHFLRVGCGNLRVKEPGHGNRPHSPRRPSIIQKAPERPPSFLHQRSHPKSGRAHLSRARLDLCCGHELLPALESLSIGQYFLRCGVCNVFHLNCDLI